MSKEKRSAADQSGSVRFFPLTARQRQPVVHVTLTVQNGLLTSNCGDVHKDQRLLDTYFTHLKEYLLLSRASACGLGINRLISEPESRVHMLDITDRVSVLDLWAAHAINISLCTTIRFLL